MIELRDYQQKGVDDVREFFAKGGKKAIFQAPTGSGKTIIFSYIAQNAALKGNRTLILTDRFELLTQTGGAISKFGIMPYYIQAGTKYVNQNHKVYVAMCQTLRNRMLGGNNKRTNDFWKGWLKNNIDLIIIDEAHRQDFSWIFESGLVSDKPVLGFTATPQRSGSMRQLAADYEAIIETVSVNELIKRGYLVRDDYYGIVGADVFDIKIDKAKGDFDSKDMFSRFDRPKLYSGVVNNWLKCTPHTKTLIFCVNIEHVINTCDAFHKIGIDARFVVSGMKEPKQPDKNEERKGVWVRYEDKMRLYHLYKDSFGKWSGERSIIISKFKKGEFPVLINAGILTTGFDCPDIETVTINRATTSLTLWLQMIGRGSRISPGKTHFNVLDFGSNAGRLGHYTMGMAWSLWHKAPKSQGGGTPVVKDCKGCKRLIPMTMIICIFCGHKPAEKALKEANLEMVVFDAETGTSKKTKKINEMDDGELYVYYQDKGHKPAWLWRLLYYRGGVERIEQFGKEHYWKMVTIEKAINYTKKL